MRVQTLTLRVSVFGKMVKFVGHIGMLVAWVTWYRIDMRGVVLFSHWGIQPPQSFIHNVSLGTNKFLSVILRSDHVVVIRLSFSVHWANLPLFRNKDKTSSGWNTLSLKGWDSQSQLSPWVWTISALSLSMNNLSPLPEYEQSQLSPWVWTR